jgi:hypothetical protein
MTDTTFVAYSNATPITAAWLNDVNLTEYHLLGNAGTPPATVADVLANIGADAKYAALAGTNSFTGANTFNNNTIYSIRDAQTSYITAAFQAQSTSGDVHIGLHASGTSAASIKHIRGTPGISVVEDNGVTLVPVSAGAASSATQLIQYAQAFGIGQTWQDVTASRVLGTTYTNTTGKPIQVSININVTVANAFIKLTVNGLVIVNTQLYEDISCVSAIIPIGGTYVTSSANNALVSWFELK